MIYLTDNTNIAPELRIVLKRLAALFGTSNFEEYMSVLGGRYCSLQLHQGIEELCSHLRPDVVALVDVFTPPDFILNSSLGRSYGEIYKELQNKFADSMNLWKLLLKKPIIFRL